MKYPLNRELTRKLKKSLSVAKKRQTMWQTEIDKAKSDRKKYPAKYYKSITDRIRSCEIELEKINAFIKDANETLKNKYIKL